MSVDKTEAEYCERINPKGEVRSCKKSRESFTVRTKKIEIMAIKYWTSKISHHHLGEYSVLGRKTSKYKTTVGLKRRKHSDSAD